MLKDRPEMMLATSNKGLQVFLQTVTLHCIVGPLSPTGPHRAYKSLAN